LVFLVFPEFVQVMKDLRTQSAQYLLRHYPTPQAVVQCGVESLNTMLRRVSHGKLGRERAQALYEVAQESAGLQEGREGMFLEMEHLLLEIDGSNRFIEQVEQEMSRYLEQIPYSSLILSLKGIGEITAAGLIGEVGDFKKFPTASEVEKLAGLDLFEISSGKHKGNRHISKRGRPLLRKLLYFAAMNTVRTGGVMHVPYQRHLERGMPKIKALVAIARKLLRIIFALVRDHRLYNENYSQRETLRLAA
jgi:transposase